MSTWMVAELSKLPKLDDPIFIEGLPGIGNVGKLAVDFIVEEVKARPCRSFFSYSFLF